MIIIPTRLPLSGPRPTFGIIIRAAGRLLWLSTQDPPFYASSLSMLSGPYRAEVVRCVAWWRNIILALLFVVMAAIIAGSRDTGGGRAGYHYWRMMTGIFG